jgi:hypothetical protein
MRDLHSNIGPVLAIGPDTLAADNTPAAIDLPSRRGRHRPRPSQTRTSEFPASGSSRTSFAHGTAYR